MTHLRVVAAIGLVNFAFLFALALAGRMPEPATAPVTVPATATDVQATPRPATTKPEPPTAAPKAPVATPPPADTRCIVTIRGARYNVTNLRMTHTGGDIFVCGTDMTAVFFGQHNQTLFDSTMRQYLVP